MKKLVVLTLSIVMLFTTFTLSACGEDKIFSGHYEQLTTGESISILKNEVQSVVFNETASEGKGYELSLWANTEYNETYTKDGNYYKSKIETESHLSSKTTLNSGFINTISLLKSESDTEKYIKSLTTGSSRTINDDEEINNSAYYDNIYYYLKNETSKNRTDSLNFDESKKSEKSCTKQLADTDDAINNALSIFKTFANYDINSVLEIASQDLTKAKIYVDKNDSSQYKVKIVITDPAIITDYYPKLLGYNGTKNIEEPTFTFVYNNATKQLLAFRETLHIKSDKTEEQNSKSYDINVEAKIMPFEDTISLPTEIKDYILK